MQVFFGGPEQMVIENVPLPERYYYRRYFLLGFGIPLANWLRQWKQPELTNGNSAQFKPNTFDRRWDQHTQGRSDERLLFAWLAFSYHGRVARGESVEIQMA
jgi:hypothetical protein